MTDSPRRGRFITLEGIDGAGKSTHLRWLCDVLRERGRTVRMTREPGGTPLGEKLRSLLLSEPMTHDTEALLMFAARREHVEAVIRPALAAGEWVLCDRFTDATYAYQCGGHGVDPARIGALEAWVHGDLLPDLTLLFDVPTTISQERLARHAEALDKFEREPSTFFERVRDVYLARARAEPGRFRIVPSDRPVEEVRAQLQAIVEAL